MTKKISQEVRKEIHILKEEGKKVKEILSILNGKGISISDKTIYRILSEEKNAGSFISYGSKEEFNMEEEEKRKEEKEERKEEEDPHYFEFVDEDPVFEQEDFQKSKDQFLKDVQVIMQEETQKALSLINKDLESNNDKLDNIIKETKKKTKPINISKGMNVFNTDGLTEEEKRLRRDLIIKIRNYIDCFADTEIITDICGETNAFKHSLYGKDIKTLTVIYEEIQIGLNSSKDYEQFMNMFSTTLKCIEFVSNILLGISITGLQDEVLNEIDEFDLRQLACELSLSRYVSPQKRVMLVAVKIILKKVLANDLLSANKDLKVKLYTYYKSINSFLGRK